MSFGKIKIDPADIAFSRWVRLRDMKCMRCNSTVKLNDKKLPITHQASHFQSRGKENTRFDPENVDTLCGGCHQYFTANPGEHYQWQVKQKGQQEVDALILRSSFYCVKDRLGEKIYWQQRLKEDFS